MYVSAADYRQLCPEQTIPEDQLPQMIDSAERDIDGLTYNRITRRGFSALTEFQQGLVKRAVCRQANFLYENADVLSSPLSSYGINGVSMSFDTAKTVQYGGVTTLSSIYVLLRQTGLTFRGVR